MSRMPDMAERMACVDAVRTLQRAWIAETRQSVAAGGPFGVCNGDELEELFIAMGIPVLAINYWNFLILAQGKQQVFTELLQSQGYPGQHFFGFALASTLAPEHAPWGGLPRPTLLCGSARNEMEMRVCEVWAKRIGCAFTPMEFSFPMPAFQPRPDDWWNYTYDRWEALVDPERLDYRIEQEAQVISYLEHLTGRTLSIGKLGEAMALINEQMTYWAETQQLIASAPRCPVHIRDQISMYQAMWHRGTPAGVEMLRAYRDETAERAQKGVAAYPNERFRLYYSVQVPPWHAHIEDKHGASAVACSYTCIPDLYRRVVKNDDPLRALAARHLFLFGWGPQRIIHVAKMHRCDAAIVVEPAAGAEPSLQQEVVEAAGIPYLAIPRADGEDVRAMISEFIERRLEPDAAAAGR